MAAVSTRRSCFGRRTITAYFAGTRTIVEAVLDPTAEDRLVVVSFVWTVM